MALGLIGCAALYLVLYLHAATLDVVYADYLVPPFITAIDACMRGQDCLSALVEPTTNGYRWTVPALLLSINAMGFGLTARFDQALGIAGLILAALTLYLWLSTTWMKSARPIASVAALVPCIFILFNLNQWENLVLGIGGYHLLGVAALILCLWTIDQSMRAPMVTTRQALILFSALIISSLFLLQYFLALVATVASLAIFARVGGRPVASRLLLAVITGSIAGLALTLAPSAVHEPATAAPQPNLRDLQVLAGFFLNMQSAALLQWQGQNVANGSGLAFALLHLFAMALSSWLFFSRRMDRISWLPLGLCIYSLLTATVVSIARFRYGAEYGYASRYTSQTVLGILACYFVMLRLSGATVKEYAINAIVVASCLAALALQISTHVIQWKIAPHRQAYYQECLRIASTFEQASDGELALFQVPAAVTRYALAILKHHRLAYFR